MFPRSLRVASLTLALLIAGCSTLPPAALPTQANVDLQRYAGTWYEQARLPNRFQASCVSNVSAEYVLQDDDRIAVTNRCLEADGKLNEAKGEGRLAEVGLPADTARLQVRFAPAWLSLLPMVWGDYWIMAVTPDYQYSLVGTPDRQYLWVLARERQADPRVVAELLDYARRQGFDTLQVMPSPQS